MINKKISLFKSKKFLLSILSFSTLAITTPIIVTSCAKSSNATIINFDDFKPMKAQGMDIYTFSGELNAEWKGKSKDEIKNELRLVDNPAMTGGFINANFRDESKFQSLIKDTTFKTTDLSNPTESKNLEWTNINVSAINNKEANVSISYTNIANTTSSFIIMWKLGNKQVAFTLISTSTQTPSSQGF